MLPSKTRKNLQELLLSRGMSGNEGAKLWLRVLTELQNQGHQGHFIACVDGPKGFSQTIETAYPKTVQLASVHMARASLH
jgi:putative transposase